MLAVGGRSDEVSTVRRESRQDDRLDEATFRVPTAGIAGSLLETLVNPSARRLLYLQSLC
jgi:hypothetical protein